MNNLKSKSLLAVLVVIVSCLPATGIEYINISNEPFATISNGPQNAVIVEVANPNDPAEVNSAVNRVLERTTRAAGGILSRQIASLRQAGLIRPDVDPALFGTILISSGGSFEPASTRASRAYGGGTITFTYTGWSASDEALLKSFVQIAEPIVRKVYGSPAKTITVEVINDTAQSEKDSLLGGAYITGATGHPQIRLWRYGSDVSLQRSFLHMMIRAFHDTASFSYDAWEEGFARAAAVVAGEEIDRKIAQTPGTMLSQMDFTGKDAGGDAFYYLMTNYELLNQPPLSNPTFNTSWVDTLAGGGQFGGMIIPRLGMSSTGWIKVYTERLLTDGQSFFKLFNDAYYQQLSSNPGIAGNVPALKGIASSLVPNVEGLPFGDWFRRQYVFDTSVSIGRKLYAFTMPPDAPVSPETEGYSMPVFLIYYTTGVTGKNEVPLSGTVYPVYWDYLYQHDLFTSGQYEMVSIENGEGYVTPTFYPGNIGGAQRVAMDFTISSETRRVYFPVGWAGTASNPRNIMGVVVGANTGSVTVKLVSDAVSATAGFSGGAFGASISSLLNFQKLTFTYTPVSGNPVTRSVNAGPGSYIAILNAEPAAVTKTLTHTFTAGTRMISIPMTTYEQDQAKALQNGSGAPVIPPDKLLLARWNPILTSTYKYEMYPRTPSFAPGKGYWIKFPSTTIVTVTGQVPDPNGSYRIGLAYGWNQIGGPFETGVSIGDIMVERANDEPLTFSEGWSTGIIGKTIWKYTPGTGYEEAKTLEPWEGYWVKCNVPEGAVLIVPGPGNRSRSRAVLSSSGAGPAVSANGWGFKLQTVSSEGESSCVALGVAPGATEGYDKAFDAELPPAFGRAATISTRAEGAAEPLAADIKADAQTRISWDVVISPLEANQDLVLKWHDVANVPKGYRLTILDHATGRSQYMRTTSSYRFNSGDGSARRFTVTADSSPTAKLMLTNVIVGQGRGSSISFAYNLTTDAQVSAEIVSPSGKVIRQIEPGRQTRSGINNLTWDKRDDSGRIAPAGIYMLQIKAATENGEMVKTVRPVLIAR